MALKDYSPQGKLWGPSPDLALPAGHLARAIDEMIEQLGLERCNRKHEHTPGEPAYDVRGMVKILIYAYARGITSSREMARQCEENLAFQFLTRGDGPDFRTLSLFRRRKRHLLRWVFKKSVALAREMGMVRLGLVAVDSIKMPANASAGKKMTAPELNEELRRLDEYLGKVQASDEQEDRQYGSGARGDELPVEIRDVQRRQEKLEKALHVLKERQASGKSPKDVSIVDPEAPWVKKGSKMIRGYSGQVAADEQHQVIVAVKATVEPVDSEQLNPMLREVEKTAGQAPEQLVADSGYYTDDAVLQAAESKTECIVPDSETAARLNNPKRSENSQGEYHSSRFSYDESRDEFTCPQGKKLPLVGIQQGRKSKKIYRCADCRECPFRTQCTTHARGFRRIELRARHAEVRKIRQKLETESGKAIYRKRKKIIEPIFGRWQHNWGIRRLRLRGLAGFSVELHLLAIGHNLTKLFRLQWGLAERAAEA